MKFVSQSASRSVRIIASVPMLLAVTVILLTVLAQQLKGKSTRFQFLERLEWISYDMFVRVAAAQSSPLDTRLTGVFIDDLSIKQLNSGGIRYGPQKLQYRIPWPRLAYGVMLREMAAQGALGVGFDILFDQDFASESDAVRSITGLELSSDEFFAKTIEQASNVVLAVVGDVRPSQGDVLPAEIFRNRGARMGNIFARSDSGVLRRALPYIDRTNRVWHDDVVAISRALELDLSRAHVSSNRILIPPQILNASLEGGSHEILLNSDGTLNLEGAEAQGGATTGKAFTIQTDRIWHMGIVLASKALKLDLSKAKKTAHTITIPGPSGMVREIPLDREGLFYIDWSDDSQTLVNRDPTRVIELLLWDAARHQGQGGEDKAVREPRQTVGSPLRGKLVIVGSIGTGNNIADHGTTPLEDQALLVTKHLCVANSMLSGRFIRFFSDRVELVLILGWGVFSALLTWRLRALTASLAVVLSGLFYVGFSQLVFAKTRYYLPMFLPLFGALLTNHVVLVTYRVVFEQREQRHLKSVFNRLVAPEVVTELLQADSLNLGGSRRRITVLFADVRGFTEMTDSIQANAEEHVQKNQLAAADAEAYFDAQARETLSTVNLYLGTVADMVKKHGGTLDKYIGDCVMAFWGAPIVNPRHALECVRAAIGAQRALEVLNQERFAENRKRERLNAERQEAGQPLLSILPLLTCGTGINTGMVTVGLMGSDSHILNYTVFGRDVNLASRLEGVSGRERIVIGEATYKDLVEYDPGLAGKCVELPAERVKGFRKAVKIYEVPWKSGS